MFLVDSCLCYYNWNSILIFNIFTVIVVTIITIIIINIIIIIDFVTWQPIHCGVTPVITCTRTWNVRLTFLWPAVALVTDASRQSFPIKQTAPNVVKWRHFSEHVPLWRYVTLLLLRAKISRAPSVNTSAVKMICATTALVTRVKFFICWSSLLFA